MSGGVQYFRNGTFVSGIAAAGVWVNNRPIVAEGAGIPAAWGSSVLYQSAIGTVRACDKDGEEDLLVSNTPATFIAGDPSGGLCAWFLADGQTGVLDNRGHQWPEAGLLGVVDGTIFLKTNYQQGGISAWRDGALLWELPGAQPSIYTTPQFSALDRGRCCWTEAGVLRTYGLRTPDQTDVLFDPFILEVAGELWLGYHGGPVVLRKWDDASRGYVLNDAGGFYTAGYAFDASYIEVAWARGPGAAGDVEGAVQSLTAPMVPLTPPVDPIVPIGRPVWLGWYEFGEPTQAPRNCQLRLPPVGQPAPGPVYVETLTNYDWVKLARYIQATSDSNVDELEALIRAAKREDPTMPVLAYWTAKAQQIRVPAGADYIGVEAYRHVNESVAAYEARVRSACERCSAPAAPWLIAQCYTSNAGNTKDLTSIPPVIARVSRDLARVGGIVSFSGSGRATGYQDHPDVHPDWHTLADGIPGAPPIPPPDPPPHEGDMTMYYGKKMMMRLAGNTGEFIKVICVHHQDETYLDPPPQPPPPEPKRPRTLIYGLSLNFPSGNLQYARFKGSEAGAEAGTLAEPTDAPPGSAERVTFASDYLMVARPNCGKDGTGVARLWEVVNL